jgi:hypothetical protein
VTDLSRAIHLELINSNLLACAGTRQGLILMSKIVLFYECRRREAEKRRKQMQGWLRQREFEVAPTIASDCAVGAAVAAVPRNSIISALL